PPYLPLLPYSRLFRSDHARVARHEVVLQVRNLAVEGDRLDGAMGVQQDGAAGGLVAAPRLHAHVPVLDEVEPAHAMATAQPVQLGEELVGLHAIAVDRDQVA